MPTRPGRAVLGGGRPSTTPDRVRVLVVDDSATIRLLLADLLRASPEVEVVDAAEDGARAVEMAGRLRPDVITLDVVMPGASGVEVLPALLAAHDAAVVMISTLTREGAEVTLAALEAGAFDFLPKPSPHGPGDLRDVRDLLIAKVLAAGRSRARRHRAPIADRPEAPPDARIPSPPAGLVVLGISIGGPQALGRAFSFVSTPIPPVLVVQHMPAGFTGVLAERLDRRCRASVTALSGS